MNTLFVAWKQPDSGEWIPVAKLERRDERYLFSYTRGVHRAKNFQTFSRMDRLDVVYESSAIFPLFANRLISKSRPEFHDYLRWLGLKNTEDDTLSMLALTGGIRGTDSIELFQPPSISDAREYEVEFFIRSLSHLSKESINHIAKLTSGERLFLMRDCQNNFDSSALAIRSGNPPVFIGFCPKYYTQDLGELLSRLESNIEVRVKCINIDAPLNMRLLCSVSAIAPAKFMPLDESADFQPIAGTVPQNWHQLSSSLDATFER
jgi:hypothetical protein